jgi:hypothetical protein
MRDITGRRAVPGGTLAAAIIACLASPAGWTAAAQDAPAPHWELSGGIRGGAPTGWVQVRENAVAGTRLDFGAGLNVHSLWSADLRAEYRFDARTSLALTVTGLALDGSTTIPQDVNFNGTTLAAGTTLTTATGFPHWMALTLAATRRVAQFSTSDVRVSAGLSFVALTFVLHGTLTPTSATRETQEDFVTQELPVPVLGAEYHAALGGPWRFEGRIAGGWMPWVSSLRQEGGTVYLNQTMLQLGAGVRYALSRQVDLTSDARYDAFAQNEQSNEDGNQIVMRAVTLGIGVAWAF